MHPILTIARNPQMPLFVPRKNFISTIGPVSSACGERLYTVSELIMMVPYTTAAPIFPTPSAAVHPYAAAVGRQ